MTRVFATKKLRDRLVTVDSRPSNTSPSPLGDWYATVVFSRPNLAFLVNELTMLPVLVPFAPSRSLLERLPAEFQIALRQFGVPQDFIDEVVDRSKEIVVEKTVSRSILGVMNVYVQVMRRFNFDPSEAHDRLRMAHRLGEHITSPLIGREGSANRELMAVVARWEASRNS